MRQPAHAYSSLSITIHHRAGKQFAEGMEISPRRCGAAFAVAAPAPHVPGSRPAARRPFPGEGPRQRRCSAVLHRRTACMRRLLPSRPARRRGAGSGRGALGRPAARASWAGRRRHGLSPSPCARNGSASADPCRQPEHCAERGPDRLRTAGHGPARGPAPPVRLPPGQVLVQDGADGGPPHRRRSAAVISSPITAASYRPGPSSVVSRSSVPAWARRVLGLAVLGEGRARRPPRRGRQRCPGSRSTRCSSAALSCSLRRAAGDLPDNVRESRGRRPIRPLDVPTCHSITLSNSLAHLRKYLPKCHLVSAAPLASPSRADAARCERTGISGPCGRLRPRWRGLAAGGGRADAAVASARRA